MHAATPAATDAAVEQRQPWGPCPSCGSRTPPRLLIDAYVGGRTSVCAAGRPMLAQGDASSCIFDDDRFFECSEPACQYGGSECPDWPFLDGVVEAHDVTVTATTTDVW